MTMPYLRKPKVFSKPTRILTKWNTCLVSGLVLSSRLHTKFAVKALKDVHPRRRCTCMGMCGF